jgi:hypothetical protein
LETFCKILFANASDMVDHACVALSARRAKLHFAVDPAPFVPNYVRQRMFIARSSQHEIQQAQFDHL